MPPRHPSVLAQAAYCRNEALRMRADAETYAAGGDWERAGLALVVAAEAEACFRRLLGESHRLADDPAPAVIDAAPRRAVG